MLARVLIPTGAGPRLGMASVYTKYLSAKGTGGEMGAGAAGRLPHHRQDPLCPESGSQSPRLSQPPQGLGLSAFLFLSSPLPQPSSEQTVGGGPGQAMEWTPHPWG